MSYTIVRCGSRIWIYEPGEGVTEAVERLVDRLKKARESATLSARSSAQNDTHTWYTASQTIETTSDVDEEEIQALLSVASLLNLGIFRVRVVNGIAEPVLVRR